MLDCIEWLDKHDGTIVALATLALLGVTYWYARTTARLLREAQAQRAILTAQALAQALLTRASTLEDKNRASLGVRGGGALEVLKRDTMQALDDNARASRIIDDLKAQYDAASGTASEK